jgi:hypothetical protein
MKTILLTVILASLLLSCPFARDRPEDIVGYCLLLPENDFVRTMDEYKGREGRMELLIPVGYRVHSRQYLRHYIGAAGDQDEVIFTRIIAGSGQGCRR